MVPTCSWFLLSWTSPQGSFSTHITHWPSGPSEPPPLGGGYSLLPLKSHQVPTDSVSLHIRFHCDPPSSPSQSVQPLWLGVLDSRTLVASGALDHPLSSVAPRVASERMPPLRMWQGRHTGASKSVLGSGLSWCDLTSAGRGRKGGIELSQAHPWSQCW